VKAQEISLQVQYNIPDEKLCPKCGIVKSASDFYVNSSRLDGLTYSCKECVAEYNSKPKENKRVTIAGTFKTCKNCNRKLPSECFSYFQHNADKLRDDCRTCRMYRKKNPTLEQVVELEKKLRQIYKEGVSSIGDVNHHRSEFEQFVYKKMLASKILKEWKPPVWIHKTSIPE
jgi:hypothetical protein